MRVLSHGTKNVSFFFGTRDAQHTHTHVRVAAAAPHRASARTSSDPSAGAGTGVSVEAGRTPTRVPVEDVVVLVNLRGRHVLPRFLLPLNT